MKKTLAYVKANSISAVAQTHLEKGQAGGYFPSFSKTPSTKRYDIGHVLSTAIQGILETIFFPSLLFLNPE